MRGIKNYENMPKKRLSSVLIEPKLPEIKKNFENARIKKLEKILIN